MEERAAELLPVPYFHVVFTLPEMIGPLALQNPRAVYGILFQAAAETLLEVAATPRRLGAKIGFLAVLHTWGQNLMHHPHLHCVVPGGGLSPDGSRWIPCREGFFLPVRILSRVFRGKFLSLLRKAYQRGKLRFYGELKPLEEPEHFERWLDATVKTEWVVYAKPPFGGPEQVLKYLARYTHRVAISNDRLIALEDGRVRFHWKDYAARQRPENDDARRGRIHPAISAPRAADRLHEDPSLRLSGQSQSSRDGEPRAQLLDVRPTPPPDDPAQPVVPQVLSADGESDECCPACKQGRMVLVQRLLPERGKGFPVPMHQKLIEPWDTS